MRVPSALRQRSSLRFNITPMIDVVFLLIIFFLVASHVVRSEQSDSVALPQADAGNADASGQADRLTITIQDDGRMRIAGRAVFAAEVSDQIRRLAESRGENTEVRIRAHKDGTYGPVREIMEACAEHGVTSVEFAVDDR